MVRRREPSAAAATLVVALLSSVLSAGCQNWDLKRPEQPSESDAAGRSFTPLSGERTPLTSDVAWRRLDAIEAAAGERRLELVDRFFEEFPEARRLPQVHRLAGESHLSLGRAESAAAAFERAVVLTRTDLLGVPLETELPLQLGMARIQAGQVDDGIEWLARVSIADHGPRVRQALLWAHAEHAADRPFDEWLASWHERLYTTAPGFSLPGLQQERVDLEQMRGKATLINFWSPT